jgi:DNA-binding transcriptional ArsR family regulator
LGGLRCGPSARRSGPVPGILYSSCVDTHTSGIPSDDEFQSAVGILKLLADETRLRILWALLHGEHSVNDLADHVGAQPAGVSQHLAKLRLSRLVRTRRHGTRIFYVVENAHVRRLVEEAISHVDHIIEGIPGHDGASASRTAEVEGKGA